MAEPFFSPYKVNIENRCLICNGILKKRDAVRSLGDAGWATFKINAKKWSEINIPLNHEFHVYTAVYNQISDVVDAFGTVHNTCRANFGTKKHDVLLKEFGKIEGEMTSNLDEQLKDENMPYVVNVLSPVKTRSKIISSGGDGKRCFVCNETTPNDENDFINKGLGRCIDKKAAILMDQRKNDYLLDKTHRYHEASQRLDLLLSGTSHDIFAKGIYYHQTCYLKFTHPYLAKGPVVEDSREQHALESFFHKIRKKVLWDKCAFLLHELLLDVADICNEVGLENAIITCTKSLKRELVREFGDSLGYKSVSKYVIVFSSDTNPCDYAIATLRGCGLRDDDLLKSFGRLIKRKLHAREKQEKKWPLTPDEMIEEVDKGPSPDLYNAIYYSLYDSGKPNSYGYIGTDSRLLATKIWSLASDWEALITRKATPKQEILGLVLHRITGSREVIDYLHKSNHAISYNAIRMQNQAWSRMVTGKKSHVAHLRKGVVTHSTIDNNDGRQETLTGAGTTHDTNKTLFQIPSEQQLSKPTVGEELGSCRDLLACIGLNDDVDPKPYKPRDRVGPELFPTYQDDTNQDEINFCLKRDIVWSLAGSLPDIIDGEAAEPIGSWTAYHKMISSYKPIKCVQEYLPVSPHPPEYPICKQYLDFLLDIIEDLDLPYIFVHSDEAVYSKLCDILWQNKELYEKVILLMGGFHQVRVMQKLIYKRYYCRKMDSWCVDSAVIAKGSADQAFEGRHYYRCLRMHKECFDSLVQQRIENITEDHSKLDPQLLVSVKSLRKNPNSKTFNEVLRHPSLDNLVKDITSYKQSTEEHVTVEYLKDVSLMLSLISAVREGNLRRHLQAERQMLKLMFAFDHQNYARYCSYQHVFLESLRAKNHPAFDDLILSGFGASRSGDTFSSVHGDLITEFFNKETKGTAGPFRAGFSTDINAVNNWVRTIHIHCKLREQFREILNLKTSSKHKELTIGARKLHSNHVSRLRSQIRLYGIDPFSSGAPKSFSNGIEIPKEVLDNILNAADFGNVKYLSFIKERLVEGKKNVFDPIKKNKLNLGIKKKQKVPKAVEILKEDKQAFGLLVAKSVTMREAFNYPITSIPLSIATTECGLRQSNKSQLRATLIETSGALSDVTPTNCAWFIDGMAAIRAADPKPTYKEFFDAFLVKITPAEIAHPTLVGIINDTYRQRSTKAGTRLERGDPGPRTHMQGTSQHMLQGLRWKELLHNIENKTDLIELLAQYMQSFECRSKLPYEFIVTAKERTIKVSNSSIHILSNCNHEEADTRLILHALLSEEDCVIVASDTDVLIILVWAYNHFNVQQKWYFRYESNCFVDISTICKFFGEEVCSRLTAFHALTGCDQTSYFYGVGKSRIFEKALKNRDSFCLLDALTTKSVLTRESSKDLQEFVRKIVYSGKEKEDYVETRVRMYEKMKNKSSVSLPPDPDSLFQHCRRAQLQNLIWCCSGEMNIERLNPVDYGWLIDEEGHSYLPLWFSGPQLPPSLSKRKKSTKKKTKNLSAAATEGDDENSDVTSNSLCRRVLHKTKHFSASKLATAVAESCLTTEPVATKAKTMKGTPLKIPVKKRSTTTFEPVAIATKKKKKNLPMKIPVMTVSGRKEIASMDRKESSFETKPGPSGVKKKEKELLGIGANVTEDIDNSILGDDEQEYTEAHEESSHDSWWEVSDFNSSDDSDSDW